MAKTLSAFNYYGGKAKMAPLICDMLDYRGTNVYIEPFGGGARTLLNKPRHEVEIYNDASAGLCAFMNVIGDSKRSNELIDRLYQTEYSPDEFYNAVLLRNRVEDNYLSEFKRQTSLYLKQLISKYNIDDLVMLKSAISHNKIDESKKLYQKIIESGQLTSDEMAVLYKLKEQLENCVDVYWKVFANAYREALIDKLGEFKNIIIQSDENQALIAAVKSTSLLKFYRSLKKKVRKKVKKACMEHARDVADLAMENNHDNRYMENGKIVEVDEMDLAVATYVIYSQSRDGMGTVWSASKYKSTDDYHRQLGRLYDVAERMRDVQINQNGALGFLLDCAYLNNENVCFYLDPSYLKPEDEKKNLGKTYKISSDYDAHELLLQTICDAKAKILISNYDLELYNRYLTPKRGWSKMEFETTTSVGGKKNNKRTEVLWWNY